MPSDNRITVLMVDDDGDDRLLVRDAFRAASLGTDLRFVSDGEELLRHLRRQREYSKASNSPRPGLILLDLNMPRMDGREALAALKADPELRLIPVIVMSTSRAPEDVEKSYRLGAASFISKPVSYTALLEVTETIDRYWLHTVSLPRGEGSSPT